MEEQLSWWCAVRLEAGVGLVLPGQGVQNQGFIRAIVFPVQGKDSPEVAAVNNGLFPFMFIRPALDWEIAVFYEQNPDAMPAVIPEPFLDAPG